MANIKKQHSCLRGGMWASKKITKLRLGNDVILKWQPKDVFNERSTFYWYPTFIFSLNCLFPYTAWQLRYQIVEEYFPSALLGYWCHETILRLRWLLLNFEEQNYYNCTLTGARSTLLLKRKYISSVCPEGGCQLQQESTMCPEFHWC